MSGGCDVCGAEIMRPGVWPAAIVSGHICDPCLEIYRGRHGADRIAKLRADGELAAAAAKRAGDVAELELGELGKRMHRQHKRAREAQAECMRLAGLLVRAECPHRVGDRISDGGRVAEVTYVRATELKRAGGALELCGVMGFAYLTKSGAVSKSPRDRSDVCWALGGGFPGVFKPPG